MNDDRLTYSDIARILGTGLISTGVGLLFFVAVTVFWGDPFTKLGESQQQEQLERQLAASLPEGTAGKPSKRVGLDPRITRADAARYKRGISNGDAAAELRIPKIGVDKVVVKGTGIEPLKKGPGLYPETGYPGSGGPVAIAGHRTTYGAPFLNIDQLKAGDSIIVQMPYGRFEYAVTKTSIITPTDWSIIDVGSFHPNRKQAQRMRQTGRCSGTCEHLVLTACHPKYSARQRIAVFAQLKSVSLAGGKAARA